MSSLVDSLRKVGTVHCRGEFTLDMERADSKMARFQFREEHEFLYHLVAGLYRLGARGVGVSYEEGVLSIAPQGLGLPDELPKDLAGHIFEEFSPWRRLAAACQALLAHGPDRFEWLGQGTEQSYDYLTDQATRWTRVQLREVRLAGLATPLVEKALKELAERASYSRRPLSIQGRALPCQLTPKESLAGQFGFFFCDPTLTPHLELVVDEMTSEGKTISSEIPWWGVVYWDVPRLRLDASLAAVVEDEAFNTLLQAIPQTFAGCVLELLPKSDTAPNRAFLLDLLRPPAPLWLHSIYAQISRLELFRDQHGERWSLASLQRHCELKSEPLYYSTSPSPTELPDIIVQESCPSALACLHVHLGDQFVEATPLLLRQLQRQANHKIWQERPQTGLHLPVQNWLVQRTYDDCVMGIPEDWCQHGGSVSLLHQGKLLVHRSLPHTEVSFAVVCEISEAQIAELWNDVKEVNWLEWLPVWLERLEKMLEELAQSPPQQLSPMRRHLLEQLARNPRPEDSYFAKTLLFRDWKGQLHSIFSLLTARGEGTMIGHLAPHHRVEDYPAAFLPKAIYIQAESLESRCLAQVKALSLRDFDVLLADLQEARHLSARSELSTPWAVSWQSESYRARLEITPQWGEGEVHLFIQGIKIETESIPSEVSFVAHVHSDEFKLQIRTGNSRLGPGRYGLAKNAPWKHCQEELVEQVYASLCGRLESLPQSGEPWSSWALQAILRGYAKAHPGLAQVVHFPAFPQEQSLASLLATPTIHWCSERPDDEPLQQFLSSHSGVTLVAPLPNSQQRQLEKAYGGQWTCQDGWFAQSARLQEFLKRPAAEFGHPQALTSAPAQAPLQGTLLLIDDLSAKGSAAWHYRQRSVMGELIPLAPALLAQVECDQLEPNADFTAVGPAPLLTELNELARQQLIALLVDWLRTPHPKQWLFSRVWSEWQQLDPEVEPLLRQQPWFSTNQGLRSWEELMEQPTLYRLPAAPGQDFADLTIALDAPIWHLLEAHPKLISVLDTQQLIEDRLLWKRQQANLRCQSERLQRYAYRVKLQPPNQGEIALVGEARKDCWLVLTDRAVLIHNLPNGLAGYLQSEDYKLSQVGDVDQARLGQHSQQQILADALPLWLSRIEAGNLTPNERELVAEYALQGPGESLLEARWLPCADGTLSSLRQLQLESAERGQLLYWERKYPFSSAATLTPLLTSPLLVELVQRCCGVSPTLRPKPILFRNLSELAAPRLSNVRDLIEGLGRWIRSRPGSGLVQAVRNVLVETQAVPQETGLVLLTALRRQAGLMLQGVARDETLRYLEQANWSADSRPLAMWRLGEDGSLTLYAQHAALRRWLGDDEPPPPVTLSLLLGLVSVINARSVAFTDEMEQDFLEHLLQDLVASYKDLLIGSATG